MDKITINLLPKEIVTQELDKAKKNLLTKIAVILLVVLIVATSAILAARIFQKQNLDSLNNQLAGLKSKISALKDQEELTFYLKQRLTTINRLKSDQDQKATQSYNLITALTPATAKISRLSLDKNNNIILTVEIPDVYVMQVFFENLISPKINQGKISKVRADSLSKTPSDTYRADLTIFTQ